MKRFLNCVALFVLFCMVMSYNNGQGIESIVTSGFCSIFTMLLALQCDD